MDASIDSPKPRLALWVTLLTPLVPQLFGSAFNIWYNFAVIEPLLSTAALKQRFLETCVVYNGLAYPIAMFIWVRLVFSIGPVIRTIAGGGVPEATALATARRRTINLPWSIAVITSLGWLICIPAFLLS